MDFNEKKRIVLGLLLEEEEMDDAVIIDELLPRQEIHSIFRNRKEEGSYNLLIDRHLSKDEEKFRQYFRLTPELFKLVLDHISSEISSTAYNRHKTPISPDEKLCVTLRYLSTGESLRSLAFQYRISHSWLSLILREVLKAIVDKLMPVFLPEPSEEELKKAAALYGSTWHFPNCCGAIDGKHVRIVCPKNSGSKFYNYKNFFSVVLLAIVDPSCKFTTIDVGSYGREGDAGIFPKSKMGQKLLCGEFPLPPPKFLPHSKKLLPHVLLGDSAFSLSEFMLKPFPVNAAQKDKKMAVFNYRLCRARRTSENAFGILCQVFRVFFTPISLKVETTDLLIVACCTLHNMLRHFNISICNDSEEHVLPTKNMLPLGATNDRRSGFGPSQIREAFADYFVSKAGKVLWQDAHVNRTN